MAEAKRPEITCVQSTCGRRTNDFYQVDGKLADQVPGTNPGDTCAPCYEDLIRRATRGPAAPPVQWLLD